MSDTCCGATLAAFFDPVLVERIATTAQQRFDAAYISSNEIAERLRVSRPAVLHARRRQLLPEPICVNSGQIYVWERKEVAPYLDAWDQALKLRRGQQITIALGQGASSPFLTPIK